ncbi:TPR-like protein [Aureobasidium pullulans]|nr:TPR-like protein [Aureobasidium pullulans]
MATLSAEQTLQLRTQLHQAVIACNDRCLYRSAKWAAELLNSFPEPDHDLDIASDTEPNSPTGEGDPWSNFQFSQDGHEARLERREYPKFLMAKSFFDCREFDRCAATLLPSLVPQEPITRDPSNVTTKSKPKSTNSLPGIPQLSQRSLFLALYAKYMAGEKRKEEDSEMILGPTDGSVTLNKELSRISNILDEHLSARGGLQSTNESQGFLEYLYGIVLLKGKNDVLAKAWLLKSVNHCPWNWGAWQELADLLSSAEELNEITDHLPQNIMTFMFHIYCSQELFQSTEKVHNEINQISSIFPNSAFLQTQRALLHYHSKEFEEADGLFADLLSRHPYRLDSMDSYSNILYVMPSRPKLAYLASVASAIDKFRPETCCIIGNYYSQCSEHEKAVMYFRRALTLDRQFLSAWTLMGHEYIELKNTQAAIESYRRAVDANRKDYRAWYGLGQGYELLDMHSYALFYFQRAVTLQPWDPKMWMAVANSFANCGRLQNAIRSYKRALVAGSYLDNGGGAVSFTSSADPLAGAVGGALDPEILYQIALLFERDNNMDEASAYMELTLAQEEGPDEDDLPPGAPLSSAGGGIGITQTTSKARLWLAKWSFVKQDWQRASELANELCQDGVEVEEAKALVRDVRARLEAEGHVGG